MNNSSLESKTNRVIYCHFSFRRPSNKEYGLFAVAFYSDFNGKKLIKYTVKRIKLWKDHQFVTAIQSYENALACIYENQGMIKDAGINQIMLVTDNSTLAGWILNPKKNKKYFKYMEQAVNPYRAGSFKEIVIGIGICEPRDAEKSYKYCKEEFAMNEIDTESNSNKSGYKLDIGEYKTVADVLENDKAIPDIEGIKIV